MTIRRLFISICATSLLLASMPTVVNADEVERVNVGELASDGIHPELVQQLRSRKAGSVKFWEAVAWCETHHKWNDGGYYSGGLGIAQSVWFNYGGRQFAPSPSKATKEEQIIVANRVAFMGFQTKNTFRTLDDKENNRPFFRPAQGWRNMAKWGKNCVIWKTRKPRNNRYTEAGIAEWKKQRQSGGSASVSSESAGVTSMSMKSNRADAKRCPQWEKKLKAHGLVPVKKFSYVMWRESRCQEKVVSKKNSNGTRDYGLLQINSSWKTVTRSICGGTNMNVLLDAKCNLKVARYLFDNGGIGHWSASSGSDK